MLTGRAWFQKVKQQYSSLEQNPKLRVIPNPWVMFWHIAEMNQKSRELGTDAAGFGQAFPETVPEKISPLLLPSVIAHLKDHADKEQDSPLLLIIWRDEAIALREDEYLLSSKIAPIWNLTQVLLKSERSVLTQTDTLQCWSWDSFWSCWCLDPQRLFG